MDILIVLIILLLLFGGGGYYVGRPGYSGAGAGLGNILYVLAAIALIVIVPAPAEGPVGRRARRAPYLDRGVRANRLPLPRGGIPLA